MQRYPGRRARSLHPARTLAAVGNAGRINEIMLSRHVQGRQFLPIEFVRRLLTKT
jgi:hypothetical protein